MKSVCLGILILALSGPAWAQTPNASSEDPAAGKTQAEKKAQQLVVKEASVSDKAIEQIDAMITKAAVDKSKSDWRTSLPKPAPAVFDPQHSYFVRMETTKGPILIKFMPEVAPMHVTSFIYLTRLGFYDGLIFHRVIPKFMAQGGCPLGLGSGGPGYKYAGEFDPEVSHDRPGLLSMANAAQPGTDGSQFFITFVPVQYLDGKHTIFGEVVEGLETLKKFEAAGSSSGKTSEKLVMEKVTIVVK
ncbi:MAG: peptidylprolyl isomerase [Candidatus Eisenbacteria bacterium]